MDVLEGIGIAGGIAIGNALLVLDEDVMVFRESITEKQVRKEVARFRAGLKEARRQTREMREELKAKASDDIAFIFDAQRMILNDPTMISETIEMIRSQGCRAEWAFNQVLGRLLSEFEALEDPYFAQRAMDLKDAGKRLLHILKGDHPQSLENLQEDIILVGSEFGPSKITSFDHPHILGFATDKGGQTTHTAIIAKALGVPAVLGLHAITRRVSTGDQLILDSHRGVVIVNPDPPTLAQYRDMIATRASQEERYRANLKKPAESLDGREIELLANIEIPQEAATAPLMGARGVGLYRTEFLFLRYAPEFPTEEAHFQTYCEIAAASTRFPVTLRTFDLGGEKFFHQTFRTPKELNPVMGLRAVRLCLQQPHMFRTQLRGMLRATALHENIRIMFPLITGVAELLEVLRFVDGIKAEMREHGEPFRESTPLGVMIEVPSAAMVADFLAEHVDFFSIGTNDLLQYFLAIDRSNDAVNYLYDPFHPGFIRLLRHVIRSAKERGVGVTCCGEIASSPVYACLLIQLGLRSLSMNPSSIPNIHNLIQIMDFDRLNAAVPDVIQAAQGKECYRAYVEVLRHLIPKDEFHNLIPNRPFLEMAR